jgi:hypothetical protein
MNVQLCRSAGAPPGGVPCIVSAMLFTSPGFTSPNNPPATRLPPAAPRYSGPVGDALALSDAYALRRNARDRRAARIPVFFTPMRKMRVARGADMVSLTARLTYTWSK